MTDKRRQEPAEFYARPRIYYIRREANGNIRLALSLIVILALFLEVLP